LLAAAAQKEAEHLDEKLFFEVFAPPSSPNDDPNRPSRSRRAPSRSKEQRA
jgi:hypothetical protein